MSTNYYVRTNPCPHCGRGDEDVHIGKFPIGLQGYPESCPTPWGPIRSWADWKRVLREHELTVVDEYDEVAPVEEFIAVFDAVPMDRRRRQHDVVHRDFPGRYSDYLDAEGWSMCDEYFS